MQPAECTLLLAPHARLDLIDVGQRIAQEWGDRLSQYRKLLYCSYHTTAGFLDERLSRRLHHEPDRILPLLLAFQKLFPCGTAYRHDQLDRRAELSEAQRTQEPRNADSHLTFIGAGLRNCVTYPAAESRPVLFIDLDGVHTHGARTRRTRVVAYGTEEVTYRGQIAIPVSRHPIDSVNLRDPRSGLMGFLLNLLPRLGIRKGRIDLTVPLAEEHVGLTVNEYETLLMREDLAGILRDPLRHLVAQGAALLLDPRSIPGKVRGYAQYDLVHIFNELLDALRVSQSFLETILAAGLRLPATRFFQLGRRISLLVSDEPDAGGGPIVFGPYQSPILIQWQSAAHGVRLLNVRIVRFL